MADLDLTDLLEDPDFASVFDVIRQDVVIGANGRGAPTERRYQGIVGVVTPGDTGQILRGEDAATTSRVITVSSRYRFRGSGDGFVADDIFFDGVRYTVKAVKLWNHLGQGFTRVAAVSTNASDPEAY